MMEPFENTSQGAFVKIKSTKHTQKTNKTNLFSCCTKTKAKRQERYEIQTQQVVQQKTPVVKTENWTRDNRLKCSVMKKELEVNVQTNQIRQIIIKGASGKYSKKILQSHISDWLDSKSAIKHLFQLQQKFTLKISQDSYTDFLQLFEYCKKSHHTSLINILSYLSLTDLLKISQVNRKLYIVSGDRTLLKNLSGKGPGTKEQMITIEPTKSLFLERQRLQEFSQHDEQNSQNSPNQEAGLVPHFGYVYTNQAQTEDKILSVLESHSITSENDNTKVDNFDIILDTVVHQVEMKHSLFSLQQRAARNKRNQRSEVDTKSVQEQKNQSAREVEEFKDEMAIEPISLQSGRASESGGTGESIFHNSDNKKSNLKQNLQTTGLAEWRSVQQKIQTPNFNNKIKVSFAGQNEIRRHSSNANSVQFYEMSGGITSEDEQQRKIFSSQISPDTSPAQRLIIKLPNQTNQGRQAKQQFVSFGQANQETFDIQNTLDATGTIADLDIQEQLSKVISLRTSQAISEATINAMVKEEYNSLTHMVNSLVQREMTEFQKRQANNN